VLTVKSTPVCKIAVLYVFPSIPTHALAEYSPFVAATPLGMAGVGIVIFPETALNVCPDGGDVIAAPDQFSEYVTSEVVLADVENLVLLLVDSLDLKVVPGLRREARRARRREREEEVAGAASAELARMRAERRGVEKCMALVDERKDAVDARKKARWKSYERRNEFKKKRCEV
jgi:hypothetical protein